MTRARANGIDIEFDVIGPDDGRPLLLIMGLGGQLIHWRDDLCALLAGGGHRVIRFDNRDAGLSTRFDGQPSNLAGAIGAAFGGPPVQVPYLLDDLADDAVGVLDALSIDAAHVLGASMGGMIAQMVAIRHPERTRSLVSIMSSPEFLPPDPEVVAILATPPPPDQEAYVERAVQDGRVLSSPGFPF